MSYLQDKTEKAGRRGEMKSFDANLELGRMGERLVSTWIQSKGYGVIPSYDYTGKENNKAPKLMFAESGFVVPDLDIAFRGRRFWVEVKTYYHAPLNRKHGINVHGIPRRLYEDYLQVERSTGCLVYLAVLEISTGYLLRLELADAKTYPCQCKSCTTNTGTCSADVKRGYYFNRDDFKHVNTFSDPEMEELRLVWDVPKSAGTTQYVVPKNSTGTCSKTEST